MLNPGVLVSVNVKIKNCSAIKFVLYGYAQKLLLCWSLSIEMSLTRPVFSLSRKPPHGLASKLITVSSGSKSISNCQYIGAGSESISRINRVCQRRILLRVNQRQIRVNQRRIRVYWRRIIWVYRRPVPPFGLGLIKTVTAPPHCLARLHAVSQASPENLQGHLFCWNNDSTVFSASIWENAGLVECPLQLWPTILIYFCKENQV